MAVVKRYQNKLIETSNPFVSIPYEYIVLAILYVLVYRSLMPLVKMFSSGPPVPYASIRFILTIIYDLLLFAPLFLFRKQLGLLHPLVFLMFISVGMAIMEDPDQLGIITDLNPFIGFIEVSEGPLTAYNQAQLSILQIKLLLLNILAQISIYVGYFFSIRWNTYKIPLWKPVHLKPVVLTIVLGSLLLLTYYLYTKGGLTAHFSSFGQGRESAVGEDGVSHVLINFGFLAVLVWFALDDKAYLNPIFWVCLLLTLPAQFILSGSRSSLVFNAVLLMLIFVIKSKKIPLVRFLALGFAAMIAIGVLGALRKSTFGNQQVNWQILSDFTVGSSLDLYVDDVAFREAQQPTLTALAKGIETEGLLWGKTYLGGMLFFVPRAIWPEKPHSIGFYTGTILFGSVGGKPPGDVIEAYWNFHIFGVILIFYLYGTFLKWLANMLLKNPQNAAFFLIYLILLFYMKPGNLGLIKCFQKLLPVLLILWMVKAIPPRIRFSSLNKF